MSFFQEINKPIQDFSINKARKTKFYKFLEKSLGFFSYGFIIVVTIFALITPAFAAVFMILFSFMWLLRVGLINLYTIYSYKNFRRWENLDWADFLEKLSSKESGIKTLNNLKKKHKGTLDWEERLDKEILEYKKIQGTKYANFKGIFMFPIFAVYNESSEVLSRSLKSIYKSGYPLDKIVVCISQEARVGKDFNKQIQKEIGNLEWTKTNNFSEKDLNLVYSDKHSKLEYKNQNFSKISPSKKKLNILFTQHPDGLEGEIKGKASNEDWGARQVSLFTKAKKIDEDLCLLTSLDADSQVGKDFFHKLSYKFCVTNDRHRCGFQPFPVYSNNFFDSHLVPRLIATQTTLYQFAQGSLDGEFEFFANYSVPLRVLQESDFWVREVIAEDYMLFAKCLIHFKGDFRVVSFYGEFHGDAVSADDYFDSIINQYKQLQRWSWGGIESLPYIFSHFFLSSKRNLIPFKRRFRMAFTLFTNHFFWATTPVVFSALIVLPGFFGGQAFSASPVSANLWLFSQYFTWISLTFVLIYGIITFRYIGQRAIKSQKLQFYEYLLIVLQWLVAPIIYGLMGIPALDSQLRGIRGKYLGYWVTPKK